MKFLHTGDLHLGRSLLEMNLLDDQKYILEEILRMAADNHVDAVIIAGDVYDRSVPGEEAVGLLDSFLRRLSDLDIRAYIISGNHDSDERLNFGSSLFESGGIYISSKFDGHLYHRTVSDEYGIVNIYLLPFVRASQVRHFFPDAGIDSYDSAVRTVIESAQIDPEERNIIAAHQFVTGRLGRKPDNAGSEGLSVQNVGTVEEIGYDCFDVFDYAALGHIHSPQSVGRREVRYSGSPLKYSLSEADSSKSVPLVTVGEKGEVEIELLPLVPRRNLRHLTGTLDKLIDPSNVTDADDYIYATLTDEDPVDGAMGIIRTYYPNTVHIDYRNSHTEEIMREDAADAGEQRTFAELSGDFYSKIYGCPMSDEEKKMLRMAAAEAGIINETD